MLRPSRTSVSQQIHRSVSGSQHFTASSSTRSRHPLRLDQKETGGDPFLLEEFISPHLWTLDKEAEAGAPESSYHPGRANHQPDGVAGQRHLHQNRPAALRTACGVGGEVCVHLSASAGPDVCFLQAGREICGESTIRRFRKLEKHPEADGRGAS